MGEFSPGTWPTEINNSLGYDVETISPGNTELGTPAANLVAHERN